MKQFKTTLEKAAKLSRVFKMELNVTEELTTEVQAELTKRESSKIAKDVDSELSWIQVKYQSELCFIMSVISYNYLKSCFITASIRFLV